MSIPSAVTTLRRLLASGQFINVPGCHDAISARLIEQAGLEVAITNGLAISASQLGTADSDLICYAEMLDQGRAICDAVSIPVIGDAQTGYGNALNVQRTLRGFRKAGFACIMINDLVSPDAHENASVTEVVPDAEAFARVRAAVDARAEGADILILASTSAREVHGFEHALTRATTFADLGADITLLQGLQNLDEMTTYCAQAPGHKLANMSEEMHAHRLAPADLKDIGFSLAIYPLTLLLGGVKAMRDALASIKAGAAVSDEPGFADLRDNVLKTQR